MYPPTYFAPTYFPPTYFPVGGGGTEPTTYGTELEAIYGLYLATPSLSSACGDRFFLDEAPEGTVLPYVTFMLAGRDIQQSSSVDSARVESLIQFTVHDRLPSGCEAIAREVRKAFDHQLLAITDATTVRPMRRTNEGLTKAEGKGPGGKDCRAHTIDYSVSFRSPTGAA